MPEARRQPWEAARKGLTVLSFGPALLAAAAIGVVAGFGALGFLAATRGIQGLLAEVEGAEEEDGAAARSRAAGGRESASKARAGSPQGDS